MSDLALPTYHQDDTVAVITMDDGKANVVGPNTLAAFREHLARAESEARAVLFVGRPGKFSAGFDLNVMTESEESMRSLVADGAEFLCAMSEYPLPIVSASTGHALAMGALMLLASDLRIGADGLFKVGLTEVAIGMPLPIFVIEFARARLLPTALVAATLGAQIYDPQGAADVGYLDRVVESEDLVDVALAEARKLGQYRTGAFSRSKRLLNKAMCAHIRATLNDDVASITGPSAKS